MPRRAAYSEGLGFGVLSFGAMALLGVVSSVVIARIYGIEVLGQYALVMASSNAVLILSSAREGPAFVRRIASLPPRAPQLTGLFVAVFTFSIALTVLVGTVFAVATYFVLSGPIGRPELFLPALVSILSYVVLDNCAGNLDRVFAAFRASRRLFPVRVYQGLCLFGTSLVLGLFDPSVWSLVAANSIAAATALMWRVRILPGYMAFRVPREQIRAGFRALPEIVRFGLRLAPGGVADGASNEANTWVLGIVSTVPALGAFSRAYQICRQLMVVNTRVTEVLLPTLVERSHRGDRTGFDRALVDTLRYSCIALLLVACVLGGAAEGVMDLFGPGFDRAADALVFLSLVPALFTMTMIQRHALYALDRPWTATGSAFIRLSLTLGSAIPLGMAFGATGAGISIVLGLVADFVFTSSRVLPTLSAPLRSLWPRRAVAALMLAYLAGFTAAHQMLGLVGGLAGLAPALAAGAIAYALVLVLLGGVDPRDRERARVLSARLRRGSKRDAVPGVAV